VEEGVQHGDVVVAIAKIQINSWNGSSFLIFIGVVQYQRARNPWRNSLTFRAPDRTLTDAEINGAHDELKRSLLQTLKCEIRES